MKTQSVVLIIIYTLAETKNKSKEEEVNSDRCHVLAVLPSCFGIVWVCEYK